MDNNWRSLHIYTCDFRLITPLVEHIYKMLGESFYKEAFFIRYWFGGPHLRLRFNSKYCLDSVFSSIESFIDKHEGCSIDRDEYYKNYSFYMDSENLPLYKYGEVIETPYERELSRYGGYAAMPDCETFFCNDSVNIYRVFDGGYNQEVIMLLYTLKYIEKLDLYGFDGASIVSIEGIAPKDNGWDFAIKEVDIKYKKNRDDYLAVVNGGSYFDVVNKLDYCLDNLLARLLELNVDGVEGIANSLLHMSFNRIGVSPLKEGIIRRFANNIIEDGYAVAENKN